jgi:hypothetical protein
LDELPLSGNKLPFNLSFLKGSRKAVILHFLFSGHWDRSDSFYGFIYYKLKMHKIPKFERKRHQIMPENITFDLRLLCGYIIRNKKTVSGRNKYVKISTIRENTLLKIKIACKSFFGYSTLY